MFEVIPMTLFSTLALLGLILLNGMWVAAEFAIVRVRRTRLEELAGQGVTAAKHAIVVVDRISDYLLVLARPLCVIHLVLRPFLRILERISTWILRRLGHGVFTNQPLTEDELKLVLAESHKGGVVSDAEAQIIVRAFEFADKHAAEIMIPVENVSYISLARTLENNLDSARKHLHARLPLCRGGIDSVMGTVSMKDVWPLLDREKSNAAFERACRPSIVLSLDLSQEDILKAFQKGRGQMGIVRDLAGQKTLGIVTLDDVLESLVGDVREAEIPGIV